MRNALEVQGVVSAATGDPFVQIRITDEEGRRVAGTQWTPDEARGHAQLVLEAAANATYEAALIEWLTNEMQVTREQAVQAVGAMRIWRADKWGQPPPEDWRE